MCVWNVCFPMVLNWILKLQSEIRMVKDIYWHWPKHIQIIFEEQDERFTETHSTQKVSCPSCPLWKRLSGSRFHQEWAISVFKELKGVFLPVSGSHRCSRCPRDRLADGWKGFTIYINIILRWGYELGWKMLLNCGLKNYQYKDQERKSQSMWLRS